MPRIHINDAGEPGECHAEKQCPFGGDDQHHDSVDQARDAYEKKMESEGYVFKSHKFGAPPFVPATKEELAESSAKAKEGFNAQYFQNRLSSSDRTFIQKVLDGKKIPDAKIDEFLDKNFEMERLGNSKGGDPEPAKAIFDHLRLVRAQSQTPSTLTTFDNFDPSTQSVFTNSDAREWPSNMLKAMKKNMDSTARLQENADDDFYAYENDKDLSEEERTLYLARARLNLEKSKRQEARSYAMFKEMKWKLENDKQFAARADPKAVSSAKRFMLLDAPGNYSVGTVRKVNNDS